MTRLELLAQLEDEIAQGYPPPLDGSHLSSPCPDLSLDREEALERLIVLLTIAVESVPFGDVRRHTPRGRRQLAASPLRAVS